MHRQEFISRFRTEAEQAGKEYVINPTVILAQAALESGWGKSRLATAYNNFFGITAYGPSNTMWTGESVSLGKNSLLFRAYRTPSESFLDYARLIRQAYPKVAELSGNTEAFAQAISCSKYISEVNGDNREAYRLTLCRLCRQIGKMLKAEG